ncbi:carboxypeptidase regulatory-like domain-containing protein [Rhizobium sp. KVB221]|uniref:Carboxypeptidase regulatory-like domain-containing protein n=1 Tax=Rhizobium setariae TaxID=2801340 RepID=A0A937CNK9_9HYPH|nr:carboxypeptidase-like regulatory domain-containing protein [Rhizobium setariae]MBL0373866.1 carboxypeptidase regulatory-like domain-containing protein [Rhizobium setariae]
MTLLPRLICTLMVSIFTATAAMAGSVSGQAIDETGNPVAGVHVEVVYQTWRADQIMGYGESIKAEAVTGSDGRYSIDTGSLPPGEYAAHAYQPITNGGEQANIDLVPDNNATFIGQGDAIRNFKAGIVESSDELPYGNVGIFVLNNAISDFTDLSTAEMTLVNIDTGKTYVKAVRSSGEGLVVTGIPFGTYRASVSLNGKPLQVALWGPGLSDTFGASVVHDFTMGYMGNQMQVQVKP